jgi:NADH-quinone oxidoreductase subunit A
MLFADAVQTSAGVEQAFNLADYYPVFLFLALLVAFVLGTLFASQLFHWLGLKPYKETPVKLMPYESGMDPVGSARMQFDVKFYLIAILFLVFDVELLFLYPWAVIAYSDGGGPAWRDVFGRTVFWEVIVFLASLAVGYVYAWRKGVFRWR